MPRYKKTECGVLPADWEICEVRQKGDVITGKALAASAPGAQRPYLRTKNVFDGRIDVEDVLTMPMTDAQFEQFRIRSGDVLLNEGQSLDLVGRCAIYQEEYPQPCAIQNALLRFRAREGTSARFASYLFRHCQHTGVFARIALQTTSVAHLGGSRFERLVLPWPTEVEQREIAEVLTGVDALLDCLDHLIAKKSDLKQAAMQQLLRGERRLPGFVDAWKPTRLGDLGTVYGGLVGKTKAHFGVGDSLYVSFLGVISKVVVDSQCFEKVKVSERETQNRVLPGDLLFNGSSETPEEVALCALVTEQVARLYLNSFCFGFRLAPEVPVQPLFLAYLMRSDVGRNLMKSLAQGSTRYNISKGALLNAKLQLPSLDEQAAVAAVLSDMDIELAALEARRAKTQALKQGMMQVLLTGQIRLQPSSDPAAGESAA
jgi:type I restriction enzyme S subunit